MRHRLVIAAILVAVPVLLLAGCKEEPEPEASAPPPVDPGWPSYSPMEAAIEFQLQEAHYHIRKGRYMAPDSYGSECEMPAAVGYAQWAFANATRLYEAPLSLADEKKQLEVETKRDGLIMAAATSADHLILEHGASFSAPQGYVPRCRWCGMAMPTRLMRWPMEDGEKQIECPRCGARDSFPTGLVHRCPTCHDVVAGTHVAGRCPTCARVWKGLEKACTHCGKKVKAMSRQGQTCPHCKAKWNFDAPFGSWPTRASVPVDFTGTGEGDPCSAYTAATGRACPNKVASHGAEKAERACWIHRGQKARDEVAASGGGAAAPAGGGMGGPGGGMGGGMGGPGGPPGGGMGGPGGPPGGGMGGPPGGGMGGPGGPPGGGMGGPGGPPGGGMGGPGGPPAGGEE